MGASRDILGAAVAALGSAVRDVSALYRTPPWGPVEQDDFWNVAVLVDDQGIDAHGWLARARELEQEAHRTRPIRWGPRTLDVDIIAVWRSDGTPVISDDPDLILPHPRAHLRGFVLVPWLDIDPGAELPGRGSVAELMRGIDVSGIERAGSLPW